MGAVREESTPPGRYTAAEAGEYVSVATGIQQEAQDRLSYDQLVEVAAEVGVTEESLRTAIARVEANRRAETRPTPLTWGDRCLQFLCIRPITTLTNTPTRN